jgi:hypothetical protein
MKQCVLCGRQSDTVESFQMTREARALLEKQYPGTNTDESLSLIGVCKECSGLPDSERRAAADLAKKRILAEMRLEELTHEGGAKEISDGIRTFRIDLVKTLELLEFPAEVWEWHDLLGHTLLLTQAHAKLHDNDLADTPYKQFLVRAIQCDIGTIGAIYTLLRFEWVHQAAAHVRLLCESTITLRYIAGDITNRLPQFLDYQHVEAYEIAVSILEQERDRAKPVHVQRLQDALDGLRADYERVKPRYTFNDRRQRSRAYINWCNITLRRQAEDCGASFVRLYRLVYSQLSAYIHGSEWSRRRQIAYSQKHYDRQIVLVDIATVVRTALVVWEQWARFCDEQLGWKLTEILPGIAAKLEELESKQFPA